MVETQRGASIAFMHRAFGLSLSSMAGCFLLLAYLSVVPLIPVASSTPLFAYAFAGLAAALAGVAFVVFKPRVPRRGPGQSNEEYRSTPAVVGACVVFWAVLEGAGTIAGVGYVLTGQNLLLVAMGVVIAAYWLCGPEQLTSG